MKILVAESDLPLAALLAKGLTAEKYVVDVAENAADVERLSVGAQYDLIILDLHLPPEERDEVIRKVRGERPAQAFLLLAELQPVDGWGEDGASEADDSLAKPFSFTELSARVRAVIRRSKPQIQPRLRVADLELQRANRLARRGNRRIELTPREFNLLEYLMLNHGRPVTREMIMENVWKLHLESITNVVDVYVNYLRKKIDAGCELKLIRTIRGVGYLLDSEGAHES